MYMLYFTAPKTHLDVIKNAIFDCAYLNIKYDTMYKDTEIDSYIIFDDPKNVIGAKIKKNSKNKKVSKKRTTIQKK